MTARRLGLTLLFFFLLGPLAALAGEHAPDAKPHGAADKKEHHEEGHKLRDIHPVAVVPFVGLLLSIAVLPLVAKHFWHRNRNRALVAGLFALPIVVYLIVLQLMDQPGMLALGESLHEYASFIILLGSLYTVSGGIVLTLNFRPHPIINGIILTVGAISANAIGTTGASMLLIRPFLRINKSREKRGHLPIFFIFMVSNLGGLLTPLGDPPLFLGFLRGVDFFWTMRLWPQWLLANGMVLAVFLVWDTLTWKRERNAAETENTIQPRTQRSENNQVSRFLTIISFVINVPLLAGIVAAVLLKSVLPENVNVLGTHLNLKFFGSEAIMVTMAVLSMLLTPQALRVANDFGWAAIVEVAVLFIGIFITMVPALALLEQHGSGFGVNKPWQYFWMTGTLSGFLDNAPTYVTFATLAAGGKDFAPLMHGGGRILAAISCGAVFMGALTYIGNGPNFMVKAISDEAGYRTPSFFGYLSYSVLILCPIFVVITLLFFWW